jgi:hypothetical protein
MSWDYTGGGLSLPLRQGIPPYQSIPYGGKRSIKKGRDKGIVKNEEVLGMKTDKKRLKKT